ncbi:MAG: hypothetical protein AAGA30_03280, partial [Planctomycetota bacterium]
MGYPNPELIDPKILEQVLGYLDFSSGARDSSFVSNLDRLFADETFRDLEGEQQALDKPPGHSLGKAGWILGYLALQAQRMGEASETAGRAKQVIEICLHDVLPHYLAHHKRLLFHQDQEFLFNSFFVAEVLRHIVQEFETGTDFKQIPSAVVSKINNFIGHRPVATLESQKIEPYGNEWIAPVPVYLDSVGVAFGKYHAIIEIAIDTLRRTDPVILRDAWFSMEQLKELAIDPRAFDFDHPINKRPNHHFGQWDEHQIDGKGFFDRFIVHQVTLDSLLDRVERKKTDDEKLNQEYLLEAGAVLAGTILMASGICGSGPGVFDSNTTLATLLPSIAHYRDQFYLQLIERLELTHRERLMHEAEARRQPFGAARQDLNRLLSKRRASQLVNCRLASIIAKMGFSDAAEQQSEVVPVASARILCQIDCLLSSAKQAVQKKELTRAFQIIPEVMERLKSGIHCGAIVDPWNILGFDANYSLFPANENSIPDHRVYELVDLVERILGMCSLIWSEAAATDDLETCSAIRKEFSEIVVWWRKFAPHEVMSVDAVDPEEIFNAAELVARALNLWHKGGAAAGDISFWREHANLFDSPKAYQLVIEA